MSEWKKLSDLVERKICYGIVQPGNKVGNVPIIKVNNIIAGLNTVENLETTTEEIASKYERTKLKGGELIISLVGTVGVTAIVPHSFAGCNLVRATGMIDIVDDVLAKYVKYYLETKSAKEFLYGRLNTTVQPTLNVKTLENLPIPIIDRHKIIAITSILSSLDDKIAVNRRICENLEAQAQALFKHWFIDFAPFKNGQFVESELGMIPERWRVGTLGDIADLIKPSFKPIENVDYSHYSIPAFDNNQIPSIDNGGTIKSNKFAIYDSVTLLSKLNPDHKRIWFVSKVGPNAICSTEFLPFYAKDREHSPFIYCYLNNWRNYREIANGAKGTTNSHQRIDANAILSRRLAYDKDAIAMFCNLVGDLLKLENKAIQESSRLSTLRDTLLPKLMSGQIKV